MRIRSPLAASSNSTSRHRCRSVKRWHDQLPLTTCARQVANRARADRRCGLAAAAIELGLVDELRMFRYPVVVGGGTPFLPPLTEEVTLDLIETRTFGSRVIYERYGRARDESD
jgi:hypothetical protein